MANSNALIEQIKRLPLHQQQHIYSFLEEVLVLGSQVSQITQEVKDHAMSLLTTSGDYKDGADADFVIEAATENVPIKLKIFEQLDELFTAHIIGKGPKTLTRTPGK